MKKIKRKILKKFINYLQKESMNDIEDILREEIERKRDKVFEGISEHHTLSPYFEMFVKAAKDKRKRGMT